MWKETGEYAKKKNDNLNYDCLDYLHYCWFYIIFVLYLAILGINRGVKAKNLNKSKNF